jgi:DNA-binding HxlR family transcriptional regulator
MSVSKIEEAIEIKSKFDKDCIVHQSLQLIGNKWTLLVIMSLINGVKRTHEIQDDVVGISSKVLSETLKKLVLYGIIEKKIYPVVPPKVEYSLTEFGNSLIAPLDSLFSWSLNNETKIRELYKKNQKK